MSPRLHAIATAVPPHAIAREDAIGLARELFGDMVDRLGPIHANAGIDRRWSCVPLDWYRQRHGWKERSALFVEHGVALGAQAIAACLDKAGMRPEQVDALVAVSTTGVCTPSLDALLIQHLRLRPDVARLPIFGLGCAGGALGLARAAALAQAMPGRNVLLVVVELCGLTFRPQDRAPGNVVATALFGDGAAAALLSTTGDCPALTAWGEHTWPGSLDVMGWRIEEDGFGVLFSRDIPPLVGRHFRPALEGWLGRIGRRRAEMAGWFCHPGGAKVVAALEQALELPEGALVHEREVLRQYGNMSAATVLFVLERGLAQTSLAGPSVVTALGPGFTAGFVLLEP